MYEGDMSSVVRQVPPRLPALRTTTGRLYISGRLPQRKMPVCPKE